MEYTKPALTFEQQVDLLIERGLCVEDKVTVEKILKRVSYYRLSAYSLPFQKTKDKFNDDVTIEDLFRLYTFDKHFRFFVLEYLEPIEIAVRTRITYLLAHNYGPFGYLKADNYSQTFTQGKWEPWFQGVKSELSRSKETFIEHYREKYSKMPDLPIWMASETFSFGSLSTLFSGLKNSDKKLIADIFDVHHRVFPSWLHSLCYVRNVCAHHGRLWNKGLAIDPKIPHNQSKWQTPEPIPNKKIFGILSVMYYLLSFLGLGMEFKTKLSDILSSNPNIDIKAMGFIDDWENHQIWQ